jgi:cobyrinic acid a,c-diamide synthase
MVEDLRGQLGVPRLVIAGVASGAGKTSVCVGLLGALRARDLRPQPFKVGPDYIDPSHLELAAGRPCPSLDTWMLGTPRVRALFARNCRDADIAVIEGMMGLFDGHAPESDAGSAAEVARLLDAPVVLVLDAAAMARSAAAVVRGFRDFDPRVRLAGVIANRVGGPGHAALLRQVIEPATGVPLLGWLPELSSATLPSRHLGLVPAHEHAASAQAAAALATAIAQTIDLDALLAVARSAPPLPAASDAAALTRTPARPATVRIGLARDAAFNFYYPDTLDLLRAAGADLVPFSPLTDSRMPADLGGIYLGGGFPEEHAAALAANVPLRDALRAALAAGLPCYAECGGLMYLCQTLYDGAGHEHQMVGAVPASTAMRAGSGGLTLGYREATALRDNLLCRAGEVVRGHEFHHSSLVEPLPEECAAYRCAETGSLDGYARGNLLASYIHLPFAGFPQAAERFVAACVAWRSATSER